MDNQPNNQPVMVFQSPNNAIETSEDKKKKDDRKLVKISILLISSVAFLWFIITFVVGFTVVNGISMQPTFHTNDLVLIWKLPKTWSKITNNQYIPSRSSIVIVKDPNGKGEQFIKRVIALPGESATVNNGIVSVNTLDNKQVFPDKASYGKVIKYTPGYFSSTIGSGEIFVLGDNREPGASIDSRSSMGAIPANNIIGKVFIRIWPITKFTIY